MLQPLQMRWRGKIRRKKEYCVKDRTCFVLEVIVKVVSYTKTHIETHTCIVSKKFKWKVKKVVHLCNKIPKKKKGFNAKQYLPCKPLQGYTILLDILVIVCTAFLPLMFSFFICFFSFPSVYEWCFFTVFSFSPFMSEIIISGFSKKEENKNQTHHWDKVPPLKTLALLRIRTTMDHETTAVNPTKT